MEKIIGQCPYAGIQPAELPVVRPDGQAQSSEGGEEDEGKIRTPGEMVCRSCRENGQREGQPHTEQICQDVIGGVKDGTCLYPRDGEPDEHGESQRNQGGCQKRRKADDCHAAGSDDRICQNICPGIVCPAQLQNGQYPEQNTRCSAAGQSRIGQIEGQHSVRGGRMVKGKSCERRKHCQQDDQPGGAAAQQPA